MGVYFYIILKFINKFKCQITWESTQFSIIIPLAEIQKELLIYVTVLAFNIIIIDF